MRLARALRRVRVRLVWSIVIARVREWEVVEEQLGDAQQHGDHDYDFGELEDLEDRLARLESRH